MKLFHGENYKPVWFWYKWSKNYRSMFAMCSYAFYWGMTAGASIFVIGWIMDMLDYTLSGGIVLGLQWAYAFLCVLSAFINGPEMDISWE